MSEFYDTIIIGAGTAGLTAAIYTARAEKSVLVLESNGIGGQISSAPVVENYPGFKTISGMEFSNKLFEQATALGVELVLEDASKIEVENGERYVYSEKSSVKRTCNKIIIATGRTPRKLGLEGEDKLAESGVSYCAVCDGAFYKNQTVAVTGGGNTALQSAKLLSGICKKVYLIHRRDEFRGEKKLSLELEKIDNIEFVLNSSVDSFIGENDLTGIGVINNKTGEKKNIPADGLFVCTGHIPNNEIFRGVIDLNEQGYIIATENCKTNIEGVYAAGDCRTKNVRQLTTAAADGTQCALA